METEKSNYGILTTWKSKTASSKVQIESEILRGKEDNGIILRLKPKV
jgi:hypothetical protein